MCQLFNIDLWFLFSFPLTKNIWNTNKRMDGSNCFGVVMFKCDIFLLGTLIKDAINVVVEI
jgi:hypothetical protein